MNIFEYFRKEILRIITSFSEEGALPKNLDVSLIKFELSKNLAHGDLASNAALVLSRSVGEEPKEIASLLAGELRKIGHVEEVGIAGPGFINLTLENKFWHEQLRQILSAGTAYGDANFGNGDKVNVEYVSANPTGPLHIAHARGAVFGDVISNLLEKVGYSVTREYYINDAGAQIAALGRSAHMRYCQALGDDIGEMPEGLYPGEYLIGIGQELAKFYGDKWQKKPEIEWLNLFSEFSSAKMMELIRADLSALGVYQEVFTSEREVVDAGWVDQMFSFLKEKNLVYTGVLSRPKGSGAQNNWEKRPQVLFRATRFGDSSDRALKKTNDEWTYFASDIANHFLKFNRGFRRMINIWGADHAGYIDRMKAAVSGITEGKGQLEVKLCQIVHLKKAGRPVRMSKRSGDFVTLRSVIDEIGKDIIRFIMLTRSNDSQMDFDLEKVVEQTRDNPVFYVQYAHARCCSILRHASQHFPKKDLDPVSLAAAELGKIRNRSELNIIKTLSAWPQVVESAAISLEPHRVVFYLYDLASLFHALWNKGKEEADLKFLNPRDPELTRCRLALVESVRSVIASGLHLVGVEPLQELR